ncbi:hypothetical protein JTB14_026014 [Gonioctena quinquepunctata]|nr:hypothetical protein JTB14_026014 [Gonioctena quinquepunctata]
MDVEQSEVMTDPSLQGAACTLPLEEAEERKPQKLKKTSITSLSTKIYLNEIPSQENVADSSDNENFKDVQLEVKVEEKKANSDSKTPLKKKVVMKKVLTVKNKNSKEAAPVVEEKPAPVEKV